MSTLRRTVAVAGASLLLGATGARAEAPAAGATDDATISPSPASPTAPPPPPAATPQPGVATPGAPATYPYPAYGYPAPYAYPPGYAYPPPGYPAYPQYPPAYQPYPAYPPPPPPEPAPEPPALVPTGKWRVGGTLLVVPQVGSPYHASHLSYDLRVRGESLLTHAADVQTTAGVAVFAEVDLIRYLHLGLAVQLLPRIQWVSTATATRADPFVGDGQAVDFFPQVGATFYPTRRLRILGYVAPGYSLLVASGMADLFANSGTPHGFALQLGGGILYAIGQHGFFTVRASQQWSFLRNDVHSNTTDETAEVYFRLRFFALHNSLGFWF